MGGSPRFPLHLRDLEGLSGQAGLALHLGRLLPAVLVGRLLPPSLACLQLLEAQEGQEDRLLPVPRLLPKGLTGLALLEARLERPQS
jgi:hypothetical protein